jgi:hypothetical protein
MGSTNKNDVDIGIGTLVVRVSVPTMMKFPAIPRAPPIKAKIPPIFLPTIKIIPPIMPKNAQRNVSMDLK